MKTFSVIKEYKAQYTDPIILNPGDIVTPGREEETEKWKGWIWAETKTHKGWIPKQILKLAQAGGAAEVTEYYSAKELNAAQGDLIEKLRSLNGWTWCRNITSGEEGWIPDEIIGNETA